MEVILLDKVGKLGNIGDKVSVKAGFGRNYLLPQGKAVSATPKNIAEFEERRAGLEAAAAAKKAEAEARAAKLAELNVTIAANAGDEGKLFGSIGTRDIAEAITAAGVEVAKSEVRLPEGVLREVGQFDIDVQLHPEGTDLSTALPAWLGASLRHADDGLPCAAELPRHGAALREQLAESSELYFEELAHSVLGFHTPGRPLETAWKRALFLRCCSVLGIPDNRTQMVSAGEKLWLSRTKPPAGDLFAWCATDSAGAPIDWRRSGYRPAGHPRRRVPQAAHLLGAIAATPLAEFQNAPPRPLGASLWGCSPALGAQMRRVLHGTALLPALWVLATLSGRHRRAGEIRRAWLAAPLPPAPQARKAFVQAGITLGPAGGKGATHLWRTLCGHRLCACCRVGNACGVPPRS